MKSITEYMYYLAHGIFKKVTKTKSDLYRLFSATGKILEEQKTNIFLLRRQSMILTSKGKGLDKLGQDRRLKRYDGENDEQYRKRLLNKFEVAVMAGTDKGIIKALQSLGYDKVRTEPMYIEDSSRWAEFKIFILDGENTNALQNIDVIKQTIMDVKEASSLPTLYIEMNAWYLNGDYNLDATKTLSTQIIVGKFK
ncbi:phage tail protein [Vallitalea guaymasensis]|uniref:phage tail protein n=1 Tax=Vallitalea guaymasensis TaxID=1185412 RepID=UPI000DE57559|nr:phage tail protein [Vallitalea guaymasensis]